MFPLKLKWCMRHLKKPRFFLSTQFLRNLRPTINWHTSPTLLICKQKRNYLYIRQTSFKSAIIFCVFLHRGDSAQQTNSFFSWQFYKLGEKILSRLFKDANILHVIFTLLFLLKEVTSTKWQRRWSIEKVQN